MKHSLWMLLCAACFIVSCQSPEYRAALADREKSLAILQQSVQTADRAEVCIIFNPESQGRTKVNLPVPQEQLSQLKEILSHLRPVPPAMGEPYFIHAWWLAAAKICFPDDEGNISIFTPGISIIRPESVMPESEAKQLSPRREKYPYEARWYLPDAKLAELNALPIVKQARARVAAGEG